MSLQRAAVRHAVHQLLLGRTSAGQRVYLTELTNLSDDTQLPAIAVYTLRTEDAPQSRAPRDYVRTIHVAVQIVARQRYDGALPHPNPLGSLDDDVDMLGQEVEELLLRNLSLGGLAGVTDVRAAGSDMLGADDGRRNILGERKTFEVDVEFTPCQGDASQVYDLKLLALRFDLPGKAEVTTTTSVKQDGGRNIVPVP